MPENELFSKLMESIILFAKQLGLASIGGFVGAVFAFLVARVNDRVGRNRRLWGKHRNGLLQLESGLNEVISMIATNQHLSQVVISAASRVDGRLPLLISLPKSLPESLLQIHDLQRIELKNHLFAFHQKCIKLNSDTSNVCLAYQEHKRVIINNPDQDGHKHHYARVLRETGDAMKVLLKGYNWLDAKAQTLLAETRAALKEDIKHDSNWFFSVPKPVDVTKEMVSAQAKELVSEISEIRKASRAELDQYLG